MSKGFLLHENLLEEFLLHENLPEGFLLHENLLEGFLLCRNLHCISSSPVSIGSLGTSLGPSLVKVGLWFSLGEREEFFTAFNPSLRIHPGQIEYIPDTDPVIGFLLPLCTV